jgi:hypothetical protein
MSAYIYGNHDEASQTHITEEGALLLQSN